MYWLLDVFVILFLILFAIWGFRKGIVNKLAAIIAVILLFALAIVIGVGFLLLVYKLGGVAGFAYALLSVIGETNTLFSLMGITSAQVCEILSALAFVIVGLCLGTFVSVMLDKLLKKAIKAIPTGKGVFGAINSVLGLVLYVAFFSAIVLGLFAVISIFANKSEPVEFCQRIGEFISSSSLCGLIYEYNPLVGLLSGLLG